MVDPLDTAKERMTLEDLYDAYAERILNLAYRMTGQREDARDLTQEVFLKVFEHLDRFEHRSEVYTWLYRIAVNHILNHLKKEKLRKWRHVVNYNSTNEETSDAYEPQENGTPVTLLEKREKERVVWTAVLSLPDKYRVPLVLFHYENLSYQAIADHLKISLSAVESRIFRAKKKLVAKLEPYVRYL